MDWELIFIVEFAPKSRVLEIVGKVGGFPIEYF